mgnify:CR=1 FL=1
MAGDGLVEALREVVRRGATDREAGGEECRALALKGAQIATPE